jgi:type II secretory pathway pseudopilin PulG
MNETDTLYDPESPPHTRRRKWPFVVLGIVFLALVIAGVLLVADAMIGGRDSRELQALIEELDQSDPGWRFEDLQAHRAILPNDQNSTLQVQAAARQLPQPWPTPRPRQDPNGRPPTIADILANVPQPVQLTGEQSRELDEELEKAAPALALARELAAMPRGRFSVDPGLDAQRHHLPNEDVRQVAHLLSLDAYAKAQDGASDSAVHSLRGALNAGRSLTDDPHIICALLRIACQYVAINGLERVLAQSEPSEEALAAMQRLLEQEAGEPFVLTSARGERAFIHRWLQAMESGQLDTASALSTTGKPTLAERLGNVGYVRMMRHIHPTFLRRLTELAAITKLPVEQQAANLAPLEAKAKNDPVLIALAIPSYVKVAQAGRRAQAVLRTATVAVAIERYRRAHGRWPETLQFLTPDLLREIPTDPYDGKALHYRRLPNEVRVYAVGPDGTDDGGNFDSQRNFERAGTDIGFILWSVEKRRQLPQSKPAASQGKVDAP